MTLGCALTENLTARLEYRHDLFDVNGSEGGLGFPKHDGFDDQQDLAIFEVAYTFD